VPGPVLNINKMAVYTRKLQNRTIPRTLHL